MKCLYDRCHRETQGQCKECGGFFCGEHLTKENGKLFCKDDSPTALTTKRRSLESRYGEALARIKTQVLLCIVCGARIYPDSALEHLADELFLDRYLVTTRLSDDVKIMNSSAMKSHCTCPNGHHVCSDHEFKPVSTSERRENQNTSIKHIVTGEFKCPECGRLWAKEIGSYHTDWC